MKYRVKRLETRGLFSHVFFSAWLILGIIGLIIFVIYLVDSVYGYYIEEFLSTLVGALLGPPLLALAFAGIGLLVCLLYNSRAKRKPLVVELEEASTEKK
jgi:uncharacterized membrane protein